MEKKFKIALVVYTSGLDYDDRIRKEIVSIQGLYPNIEFNIFALYDKNISEEGVTSYGVPYKVYKLKSREKYPSATHIFLKSWEFFRTVKPELKNYDAIWCADFHVFLFVLLLHGKPMLWDLHELPMMLMGKWWGRTLFSYIEKKLKVIIHANKPRMDYMASLGMVKMPQKHYVLRNYPEFNEIDIEYDDTYKQFEKWLGESECVYLQGLTDYERADVESIGAVLDTPGLKAVIVGNTDSTLKERLETIYDKEVMKERLFFTGRIKQLKTPQYIKKCIMALVFYKKTNMNNWYCEPNRFFQNVLNGTPVVIGSNPPMKELVDKYGIGVCAETDGCDVEKIKDAIKQLLKEKDLYKKRCHEFSGEFTWASQQKVINELMRAFIQ